ncbi:hypothetical protein RCL1_004669 [Eukaryota sp. TZLM3-RCL]
MYYPFLLLLVVTYCCGHSVHKSHVVAHAFRLTPNEDLYRTILNYVEDNLLSAVTVSSAVGSLTSASIRFANQALCTSLSGHFEIVSLMGTFGYNGSHVHISLGDEKGDTISGHLCDNGFNIVYTTVELVLLSYPSLVFTRQIDPETTYDELVVFDKY